jgi:hypothetical protein
MTRFMVLAVRRGGRVSGDHPRSSMVLRGVMTKPDCQTMGAKGRAPGDRHVRLYG